MTRNYERQEAILSRIKGNIQKIDLFRLTDDNKSKMVINHLKNENNNLEKEFKKLRDFENFNGKNELERERILTTQLLENWGQSITKELSSKREYTALNHPLKELVRWNEEKPAEYFDDLETIKRRNLELLRLGNYYLATIRYLRRKINRIK